MYICVDLAYLNSFGSRNRFLFFFFLVMLYEQLVKTPVVT